MEYIYRCTSRIEKFTAVTADSPSEAWEKLQKIIYHDYDKDDYFPTEYQVGIQAKELKDGQKYRIPFYPGLGINTCHGKIIEKHDNVTIQGGVGRKPVVGIPANTPVVLV